MSYRGLLVCRWRVEMGRVKGIDKVDFASFYMEERAKNTMRNYGGAFRFVWSHAQEIGRSVFEWGEGEVAGMMVKIAKEEKGENFIKKSSAVVNMLFEAVGMEGPTKGDVLKMVKKAALKKMNVERRKKPLEIKGTKLEDIEKMVEKIYLNMGNKASMMKRQFLAMQMIFFTGLKRFSDVNRILVRDLKFEEDGSMLVWVKKSKMDQLSRGDEFVITGERMKNGASVPDIMRWYLRAVQLKETAYVFCHIDQKGKCHPDRFITYAEARRAMMKEQVLLGLRKLSLHSGRIGGASEAAAAGVGRAEIMKAGGWKSSMVDPYIRPLGEGQEVSRGLVKKLQV